MTWALPGAILFLLGLVLLLGYFLSRKVFPAEQSGLPGAGTSGQSPCDGCGEAGCGGFAKALVRGGSDPGVDPAGAASAVACDRDSGEVGKRHGQGNKALVRCKGRRVPVRYRYAGAPSCRGAAGMAAPPKECGNACLGFGDCLPSCPHRALRIEDGVARVDASRCDGCGDCLGSCPLDLITMIPAERGFHVLCAGPMGPSGDWACPDGCILCDRCIEACPEGALERTRSGLPRWIEDRCNGCGSCLEACPQDVVLLYGTGSTPRSSPLHTGADRPASSS